MTDFAYAPQQLAPLTNIRIWPSIRYAGVLLTWVVFTLIQPRLGWEIFVQRRPDSPLRRSIRR
jgi:hypothetical protein